MKNKTEKPWGEFETLVLNEKISVKIIRLNKGQKTSLQKHKNREERWIFLTDGYYINKDGATWVRKGSEVIIINSYKEK